MKEREREEREHDLNFTGVRASVHACESARARENQVDVISAERSRVLGKALARR